MQLVNYNKTVIKLINWVRIALRSARLMEGGSVEELGITFQFQPEPNFSLV